MAKFMTGSICLTELNEQAKKGHSAFSRSAKNGKIYANVKAWLNDDPDEHGNIISVQINPKENQETERVYIGNFKYVERKEPQPITAEMAVQEIPADDDLPF